MTNRDGMPDWKKELYLVLIMLVLAFGVWAYFYGPTQVPKMIEAAKSRYEQWQMKDELELELAGRQGIACEDKFEVMLVNEDTMLADGKATFRFEREWLSQYKSFYLAVFDGSQEMGEQELLGSNVVDFYESDVVDLSVALPNNDGCQHLHVVTGCGESFPIGGDYLGVRTFSEAFNIKTAGCGETSWSFAQLFE